MVIEIQEKTNSWSLPDSLEEDVIKMTKGRRHHK